MQPWPPDTFGSLIMSKHGRNLLPLPALSLHPHGSSLHLLWTSPPTAPSPRVLWLTSLETLSLPQPPLPVCLTFIISSWEFITTWLITHFLAYYLCLLPLEYKLLRSEIKSPFILVLCIHRTFLASQLNGHELGQTLGDSEGQPCLACCSGWGHKELDRT